MLWCGEYVALTRAERLEEGGVGGEDRVQRLLRKVLALFGELDEHPAPVLAPARRDRRLPKPDLAARWRMPGAQARADSAIFGSTWHSKRLTGTCGSSRRP